MFDKKEWDRKYYAKNREKICKRRNQYRQNNLDKMRERDRNQAANNKDKKRESNNKHRLKNKEYYKEYMKEYMKEYRKNNIEKISANRKEYREKNRETLRVCNNEYRKNKLIADPGFKLNRRIKEVIRRSLKGNKAGRHWEELVGYSLSDLMKHLKQTLPLNYTWKNYLDGTLHVDHIIPISAYEFDKSEEFQFKECWSLNNLRLLPAKENLTKGSKIIKPYQLALKI